MSYDEAYMVIFLGAGAVIFLFLCIYLASTATKPRLKEEGEGGPGPDYPHGRLSWGLTHNLLEPEGPCCSSGNHPMVISDDYGMIGYSKRRHYMCDICKEEGSGKRWFCAQCKEDICLGCGQKKMDSVIRNRFQQGVEDTYLTLANGGPGQLQEKEEKPADDTPAVVRVLSPWNPLANWNALFARPGAAYGCLDGLRAWAVVWVILFHNSLYWSEYKAAFTQSAEDAWFSKGDNAMLTVWWFQWLARGDMGVDVFFVLSGFLIGSILFKRLKGSDISRAQDAKECGWFLFKRVMRLSPAYFVCILLGVWLAPTFSAKDECEKTWWHNLLFINGNFGITGCLGQSWSISIEMQFYLLSPFLVLIALQSPANRRFHCGRPEYRGLWIFGLLAVLSLAARIIWIVVDSGSSGKAYEDSYYIYPVIHMRLGPYVIGMATAFIHRAWKANGAPPIVTEENSAVRYLLHLIATATWIATTYYGSIPDTG